MNLWLDDVREPPPGWTWINSANAAILLIQKGAVKAISLDYDLGMFKDSGGKVSRFIREGAREGWLDPIPWRVHSMNPVGARRMKEDMLQAEEHWRAWGKLA